MLRLLNPAVTRTPSAGHPATADQANSLVFIAPSSEDVREAREPASILTKSYHPATRRAGFAPRGHRHATMPDAVIKIVPHVAARLSLSAHDELLDVEQLPVHGPELDPPRPLFLGRHGPEAVRSISGPGVGPDVEIDLLVECTIPKPPMLDGCARPRSDAGIKEQLARGRAVDDRLASPFRQRCAVGAACDQPAAHLRVDEDRRRINGGNRARGGPTGRRRGRCGPNLVCNGGQGWGHGRRSALALARRMQIP